MWTCTECGHEINGGSHAKVAVQLPGEDFVIACTCLPSILDRAETILASADCVASYAERHPKQALELCILGGVLAVLQQKQERARCLELASRN